MKTVTFDDDAYRILKGAKLSPKESFSDVVKRHFGGGPRLEESAGAWAGVSASRVKALRSETIAAFGTTAE